MLERLLAAPPFAGAWSRSSSSAFDMRDVFPPTHWAVRGEPPAFDTPDEDVYLDGRNIILLSKAAVYMARARRCADRRCSARSAGNPFPDATPEFFAAMARALSLGLAHADRDRGAVRDAAQVGRDQEGRSSWACRWS